MQSLTKNTQENSNKNANQTLKTEIQTKNADKNAQKWNPKHKRDNFTNTKYKTKTQYR